MWFELRLLWRKKFTLWVDQSLDGVWDAIGCHKDREVVIQREQPTVKHPMDGATQGESIAYGVRP